MQCHRSLQRACKLSFPLNTMLVPRVAEHVLHSIRVMPTLFKRAARTTILHYTMQRRTSHHLAKWAAGLSLSHSCKQQGLGSASLTTLWLESTLPASAATS